ncbi:hypothetical protein [Paenibacillus oleatilyticus]|uniref:Uncharacterized protein n=1 Tax=Paenibacillus oleatilyticus TaxID=2594886 RepID=A0ABV4UU75_9BACL
MNLIINLIFFREWWKRYYMQNKRLSRTKYRSRTIKLTKVGIFPEDTIGMITEFYLNKLSKKELLYKQLPLIYQILTLLPPLAMLVFMIKGAINQNMLFILLSIICGGLTLVLEYIVLHYVLTKKYEMKCAFFKIKETLLSMRKYREALLKEWLKDHYVDTSSKLNSLANILERQAEKKSRVFMLTTLGLLFLPVWGEYVSWRYNTVPKEQHEKAIETMIDLIPIALVTFIIVIFLSFIVRFLANSKKTELMNLVNIIRRISFEKELLG